MFTLVSANLGELVIQQMYYKEENAALNFKESAINTAYVAEIHKLHSYLRKQTPGFLHRTFLSRFHHHIQK